MTKSEEGTTMTDICHQKKKGSAKSNWMMYIPKPIAVRSENFITSVKASNVLLLNGDGSTQVIFDIPTISVASIWIAQRHGSHST